MSAVAALVVELLYSLFVEVLLVWTGELLRFGFTLGRRRPCFQFWSTGMDAGIREPVSASLLLGLVFWIIVLGCAAAWHFES